ncbi:uncharacterized protein TNCV_3211651 [Trichonephila clavipes]|uniref:Uncharacterized protein n=1 Tax=Trichonephila clavipes TaxID=2585209 RepID=A0A8X6SAM2_TRICX|nr:uncharacterized protein TNCV_3211651 [Trichonephila clavipes]
MPNKSPFAVHKALIGIGGEPKTVKRLRSGDLLMETNSAIQTKSFLLAKTFLNSPLIVTPHKSLNSCRGVISEPDLLTTSESEILEGFSDQAAKSSNKNSSTQTDENITNIKCPPLELLQPLSSKTRTNLSISTPGVSTSSSTQAQLLPSTSSISTSNSESQPPIPTCNDAPSNNMVTPIESSSSVIPTSSSQSVIQPPSDSNTVQDAKKLAKARSRKRKKELLKKMKEAIIDIKMNPHRPKKPASDEYTTDEEEMIVYDVEDEIESNPDYVKGNVAELPPSSVDRLLYRGYPSSPVIVLVVNARGYFLEHFPSTMHGEFEFSSPHCPCIMFLIITACKSLSTSARGISAHITSSISS